MEIATRYNDNLINLKATELCLGLPGVDDLKSEKQQPSEFKSKKRTCTDRDDSCGSQNNSAVSNARDGHRDVAPPSKKQVVGWPPVRNYRKNSLQQKKNDSDTTGIYVKVSMDGAPFLRKIDLKLYKGYKELHQALENMFQFKIGKNNHFEPEGNNTSEYEPTYEDKDGDYMLVGDVPWDMFISSCKRLRIMRH